MRKDRGLQELDSYLEHFSDLIEKRIKQKGKVKILDAGCGYGLAMAGLIKKFGNKIEVVGYNQKREHGTIKDFKERAVRKGIFTEEEIKNLKNLPKIFYFDADKGLPFKKDSFDFIFSLASVYLYRDKIKFFDECNRVLKKGGIARISLYEVQFFNDKNKIIGNLKNSCMKYFWEIWNQGAEVNFIDYFENIKCIKVGFGKRKDVNHAIVYIEIKKCPKLDFKLKLVDFIDMRPLAPDRYGIRSIYAAELNVRNK